MKRKCLSAALSLALLLSLSAPLTAARAAGCPQVAASVKGPRNFGEMVDGDAKGQRYEEDGVRWRVLYVDGMPYYHLRTACAWMGMEAAWDEAGRTLSLTRLDDPPEPVRSPTVDLTDEQRAQFDQDWTRGVAAQALTDVTVTVDGVAVPLQGPQGEPLCPLLYQDSLYLPIQSIGELWGKSVLWYRNTYGTDIVALYDPVTEDDLAQYDAWYSGMTGLLDDFQAGLDALAAMDDLTEESFHAALVALRDVGQAMLDLPLPANQGAFYTTSTVRYKASDLPESDIDNELIPGRYLISRTLEEKRSTVLLSAESSMRDVRFALDSAQWQAAAVAQAAGMPQATQATQAAARQRESAPRPVDAAAFTDAGQIEHWDAVWTLSHLGVISGRDTGAFEPDAPVTRGEMAKLAYLMSCGGALSGLGRPSAGSFSSSFNCFIDIEGHWAAPYINATAWHLLSGRGDSTFDPDAPVTGVEVAKIALRLLGYGRDNDADPFGLTGARWADNVGRWAGELGLYQGLDGIDLSAPLSRDAAAQLLYNALSVKTMEVTITPSADGGDQLEQYQEGEHTFYVQHFTREPLELLTEPVPLPAVPARPE